MILSKPHYWDGCYTSSFPAQKCSGASLAQQFLHQRLLFSSSSLLLSHSPVIQKEQTHLPSCSAIRNTELFSSFWWKKSYRILWVSLIHSNVISPTSQSKRYKSCKLPTHHSPQLTARTQPGSASICSLSWAAATAHSSQPWAAAVEMLNTAFQHLPCTDLSPIPQRCGDLDCVSLSQSERRDGKHTQVNFFSDKNMIYAMNLRCYPYCFGWKETRIV